MNKKSTLKIQSGSSKTAHTQSDLFVATALSSSTPLKGVTKYVRCFETPPFNLNDTFMLPDFHKKVKSNLNMKFNQ